MQEISSWKWSEFRQPLGQLHQLPDISFERSWCDGYIELFTFVIMLCAVITLVKRKK